MATRQLTLILLRAGLASALQTTSTTTTTTAGMTEAAALVSSSAADTETLALVNGSAASADLAVVELGHVRSAAAGMAENVTAQVQVAGEPGHPMPDCCCNCPKGTDRLCSPVSGHCYTERVDHIKPYYGRCYGGEMPRACPADGGKKFEWWWHKYYQVEFVQCKVGHGSQTGDATGFLVQDVEACARDCDYTDWCQSFSLDISSRPLRCFKLGALDLNQCFKEWDQNFETWYRWSR